jgi:hypothetical protein
MMLINQSLLLMQIFALSNTPAVSDCEAHILKLPLFACPTSGNI